MAGEQMGGADVAAKLGEQMNNALTMVGGLAEVMGQMNPQAGEKVAQAAALLQQAMQEMGGGAAPAQPQAADVAGSAAQPTNIAQG